MCYRVERGIIVECQNLPNPGLAAPKLVALLVEMGVDTLIVGAIDYDVANVFCHAGVEVIAGAHGSAREVVQAYLTRTLTGVDIAPEDVADHLLARWNGTLPPLPPEYRARVRALEEQVRPLGGVALTGAWVAGTGIASVVSHARAGAKGLL